MKPKINRPATGQILRDVTLQVRKMKDAGFTDEEIVKELGMPPSLLQKMLNG